MTREEFEKIFEAEDALKWEGDNALQGLKIMEKYIDSQKTDLIQGAEHDIIYSVDIDQLIASGITEEDAVKLQRLNWMIEDSGYMACFV